MVALNFFTANTFKVKGKFIFKKSMLNRGVGTGGAGVAIASPMILEISTILAFSTPNISGSKESTALKKCH